MRGHILLFASIKTTFSDLKRDRVKCLTGSDFSGFHISNTDKQPSQTTWDIFH